MSRRPTLFVVLLAFAGAAESNGILSADGPLALNLEQAFELLKPCWGGGPIPEGALWLPAAAEVAELETRLEKYVATLKRSPRQAPAVGVKYRGQYVGFTRGNVKHIYASYVPARDSYPLPSGSAFVVCDGGPSYWGIVYNSTTGQFSEIGFSFGR